MSQPVTTTLPIEGVTFNNVTITIASVDPAPAYAVLCQALARFEYTTDTYHTHGAAGQSEEQSTTILFPSDPNTHQDGKQAPRIPVEKDLLIFIVEFCSERLEWFCSDCYRDSAELVWLENARALLGYPPLDFNGVNFAQE
jgi:hypothetical protein